MMDKQCCENCEKCAHCHGHGMMECCGKHEMSKEHLEMKKKMLEEKMKWVEEELKKAK